MGMIKTIEIQGLFSKLPFSYKKNPVRRKGHKNFILSSPMGAEEEQKGNEEARTMAGPNPISAAQFLSWKRQKDADTSARKAEAARKRAEDIASGTVQMTGRELFLHEPWVFDNTRY